MRLTLIVVLCLLNAGCALWRKDAEEPVDNGPKQQKAEPVLKPSEALKPKSLRDRQSRSAITSTCAARTSRRP